MAGRGVRFWIEGKSYGKEADIWSLGVLYYYIYTGESPWGTSDIDGIKKAIRLGAFSPIQIDNLYLQDAIKKMIVLSPKHRISISNLVNLPIFNSTNVRKANSTLASQDLFKLRKNNNLSAVPLAAVTKTKTSILKGYGHVQFGKKRVIFKPSTNIMINI